MKRIKDDKHPFRGLVEVWDALGGTDGTGAFVYWAAPTARENLRHAQNDQDAGRGRRYWPDASATDEGEIAKARAALKDEEAAKLRAEQAKGDVEALQAQIKAMQHELTKMTQLAQAAQAAPAPPPPPADRLDELSDEELRDAVFEKIGEKPHHNLGRAKLLAALRAA